MDLYCGKCTRIVYISRVSSAAHEPFLNLAPLPPPMCSPWIGGSCHEVLEAFEESRLLLTFFICLPSLVRVFSGATVTAAAKVRQAAEGAAPAVRTGDGVQTLDFRSIAGIARKNDSVTTCSYAAILRKAAVCSLHSMSWHDK